RPAGQAHPRPTRLRRHPPVPPPPRQPRRRHAHHLRPVPHAPPRRAPRVAPRTLPHQFHPLLAQRPVLPRQLLLPHDRGRHDLLLRLLLDHRPVPAQGDGQPAPRLRLLHPRPPPRQAHRRLPREGHDAHHLRRRRLPLRRRRHPLRRRRLHA